MDMRQYDPAIARWVVQDPVLHESMSPYNGFDNNPIYWADPSGGDGEHYDWNTGNYVNGNGDTITQAEAYAAHGLNTDGSDREGDTDPKKKKKSTAQLMGEGYAMGYSVPGGGFNAAMNGRDAFKPTGEDNQAAGDAFGNTVLFFTGEWAVGKLFQGAKYLWALRGVSGFSKLSFASKYGIKPYKTLKELIKGKGLQVHHLIEQRFASALGVEASSMQSIALTAAEHQVFTNAWRTQIGYKGSNAAITTTKATKEQIYEAAKVVYKDYPEIVKALGL